MSPSLTISPAVVASHDESATAAGSPRFEAPVVRSPLYKARSVTLTLFSKLHFPDSDVTIGARVYLWVVTVSDYLWKSHRTTDSVDLPCPISEPVVSRFCSGSSVVSTPTALNELQSRLTLTSFPIQSVCIQRLAGPVLSDFILASFGCLVFWCALCLSFYISWRQKNGRIPFGPVFIGVSKHRRALRFRSNLGGSWGKLLNPTYWYCLMGYYGPSSWIRVLAYNLEVERRCLGLDYWTLSVLIILAQPTYGFYLEFALASLSDPTSPINESTNIPGFYPRMFYPGRESLVQRLSTAFKRTAFGILVAAFSWSSFRKRKTTLVKQLDLIEERHFSMPLEVLSFYLLYCIVSRVIFY